MNRRRLTILLLLCSTAVAGLITPAAADYIAPGDVEVETKKYTPSESEFSTGTYHYNVAWQGMPVAKAKVEVDSTFQGSRPFYKVRAEAKTGKFIDVFYKLRHTSESTFDADSLRPVSFKSVQKERRKEKIREVAFNDDGNIHATYKRNGETKDPVEFKSENLTLDPISAAFIARTLPISLGATAEFDVFNGKHRYLISFLVEAREKVEIGDRVYDAFKVIPRVQKLTDSKGEKRLESAAIWITADDNRDVIKLESKVFVGAVSAELDHFEPMLPNNRVRAALKRKSSVR